MNEERKCRWKKKKVEIEEEKEEKSGDEGGKDKEMKGREVKKKRE